MTLLLERLKRVFGRRQPVAAEGPTVAPMPAQPATVRDLDMADVNVRAVYDIDLVD